MSVPGCTPHVGVMAFLIAHSFVEIEILSDVPPRKLVQVTKRRAAVATNQPEEQLLRLLALQQTHRGREIRRPFHLDAPGDWPRQSFEPHSWNWRGVFATPWRSTEEKINVPESRAFPAGVAWRLRNTQNIGSRGLMLMDLGVVLAAVATSRSGSRRFGPIRESTR